MADSRVQNQKEEVEICFDETHTLYSTSLFDIFHRAIEEIHERRAKVFSINYHPFILFTILCHSNHNGL